MKEIDWNTKENKQLIDAILSLKKDEEAKCFLRDLMTVGEIKEFSNRLEAARLLSRNTQYCAIIEKTGLSSTTIARISKWLKGSLGGYRLVLNRMHHTHFPKFTGKGLRSYS
jgi:TrpR-related protein YerC/YecD